MSTHTFCLKDCDGINFSQIVKCENCKKEFHETCLAENGMQAEDLSNCGYAYFEDKSNVYFCSMNCMISLLTRVINSQVA